MHNDKQIIARIIFETCLGIQPNERVVIVTDQYKTVEVDIIRDAAVRYSKQVTQLMITGMTENAQEPPDDIAKAISDTDIAIFVTRYSLSHTQARLTASAKGTRTVSMPGITVEMMHRAIPVDYDAMARESETLANLLTKGSTVRITSKVGTDISLSIKGRSGEPDTGLVRYPGDFVNLPAGEAFIAPIENQTNGIIVFDGAVANIDLDKLIIIQVKNGRIIKISGGRAARQFEKNVIAAGDSARVACEVGIGTNPKAILSPEVLESEKVRGTCHIAFGKNDTFGGTNDTPFHADGLIKHPTLTIDDRIVLENGKLII